MRALVLQTQPWPAIFPKTLLLFAKPLRVWLKGIMKILINNLVELVVVLLVEVRRA